MCQHACFKGCWLLGIQLRTSCIARHQTKSVQLPHPLCHLKHKKFNFIGPSVHRLFSYVIGEVLLVLVACLYFLKVVSEYQDNEDILLEKQNENNHHPEKPASLCHASPFLCIGVQMEFKTKSGPYSVSLIFFFINYFSER